MAVDVVRLGLGCLAVSLAGCVSPPPLMGGTISIKSIPDTRFVCGGDAPVCHIVVAAEMKSGAAGGCEANVDLDEVRIKLTNSAGVKLPKTVKFLLVRKDMLDNQRFRFVGNGLTWMDTSNPPQPLNPQPTFPGEFEFVGLTNNNTVAEWKALNQHGNRNYRARVRPVGSNAECASPDPKIANEG